MKNATGRLNSGDLPFGRGRSFRAPMPARPPPVQASVVKKSKESAYRNLSSPLSISAGFRIGSDALPPDEDSGITRTPPPSENSSSPPGNNCFPRNNGGSLISPLPGGHEAPLLPTGRQCVAQDLSNMLTPITSSSNRWLRGPTTPLARCLCTTVEEPPA